MIRACVRNVVLVVVVMLGFALNAEGVEPVALPGRDIPKAIDTSPAWNQAEIVFIGELTDATTGAATMSIPPIYMNRLRFNVEKVLRGRLTGKTLACAHSYRGDANFPYETGKKYIVALTGAQNTTAVRDIQLADDAAIKEVELACALPLGWKIAEGKAVSPWAAMGKAAWSAELPADADKPNLTCERTGRPTLLAGPKGAWTVKVVPPKQSIQWTNPDGDGEYALTLTNPTDQPLSVPALLTQDGKILWRESVAILCQEKAYPCPGAKGVTGKVAPLVLKPRESVSTVINVLALQGPEWPQGGDRIEFTFCLGDKAKTMSFYYMFRHHDALREAAQKTPAAETKTHALPADATATVIVFDYLGGMTKPQNDDPLMVIRADGSVTLGDRYRKNARIETRITKDDLQALLRLAIDTNDFFKIDAAEIEQSIDAKVKRENEKLAAQGVVMVGPSAICDAATTVVRIHADGKDHEVQLYALDIKSRFLQNDERLTRLQNIATRLTELDRKLRAEATAAAPPGKAEPR